MMNSTELELWQKLASNLQSLTYEEFHKDFEEIFREHLSLIGQEETDDSLMWIAHYNCYDDMLKAMLRGLERAIKKGEEHYSWDRHKDFDAHAGWIYWSLLVLKFGDYGTSPRYGWIESDNFKKAKHYILKLLRKLEDEQGR